MLHTINFSGIGIYFDVNKMNHKMNKPCRVDCKFSTFRILAAEGITTDRYETHRIKPERLKL